MPELNGPPADHVAGEIAETIAFSSPTFDLVEDDPDNSARLIVTALTGKQYRITVEEI